MDLLNPHIGLNLDDANWRIYSRNRGLPPHYLGPSARVQNSIISEGCTIDGTVDFSVLFAGVTVEEGAEVYDSILMPGAYVKSGAKVQYAILAEDTVVEEDAVVGERPERCRHLQEWGVAVVAAGVTVGPGAIVPPKAMVERDVLVGGRQYA